MLKLFSGCTATKLETIIGILLQYLIAVLQSSILFEYISWKNRCIFIFILNTFSFSGLWDVRWICNMGFEKVTLHLSVTITVLQLPVEVEHDFVLVCLIRFQSRYCSFTMKSIIV